MAKRNEWALAVVGMRGWRTDGAIGDGITKASWALVSRHSTEHGARAEMSRREAAQTPILPGSASQPEYAVVPYRMSDYLAREDRRNGDRPADIRYWASNDCAEGC